MWTLIIIWSDTGNMARYYIAGWEELSRRVLVAKRLDPDADITIISSRRDK